MDKNYFINIFFIFISCCFLLLKASADIENNAISDLTPKMLRDLKTMENRHFSNKNDFDTEEYRIKRLEIELMGRSFEKIPIDKRMETLKLASQKRMLKGTSVPYSMQQFGMKKIDNDNIKVISKNDDIGIIDGLMKIYAPELFQNYRSMKERSYEMFSD